MGNRMDDTLRLLAVTESNPVVAAHLAKAADDLAAARLRIAELERLAVFDDADVEAVAYWYNDESDRWIIRKLNGNERICRRDENGRIKVMKVVGEGDGQMWFWELMPKAAARVALTAFIARRSAPHGRTDT